ncbi:MAG: hypothetical protein FJW56_00185 [Actinobacteria bacterium]|nr:hypothetical protein [Actinomycetota bacterium]
MPDEKPKLVITTVGTSLIEKLGMEKIKTRNGWVDNKNKLYNQSLHVNITSYCETKKTDEAEKHYQENQSDVKGTINLLTEKLTDPANDSPFAPAEIASLWKMGLNKEKDKVVLLYSDTPDGAFCAVVNAVYINHKIAKCDIQNGDIHIIDGLQSKDGDKFKNEGLPNLLKIISNLIKENNKEYKIVLNITGGYKGLIPYMSLIGMCFDEIDIVYLYEESDRLIRFEKLPVDFDILYWNDHRCVVDILQNFSLTADNKKSLKESLSKKYQYIFDKEGNITSFGKFISDRLEERRVSIDYYGSGRVLTELITDPGIKKTVEEWIKHSQHIWYGDLIAETVEHGRGHAQRLQEMAFQILHPIKQKNPNFISDEELQILIYTLWLHDIGHSGRKVNLCDEEGKEFNQPFPVDIGPFPSLVRDLHHYTAYLMILEDLEKDENNRVFFGKEIKSKDNGCHYLGGRNEDDAKSKGLLAALCYLYHRGKMKILENRNNSGDMIFEDAVNIIEKFSFSQKNFINNYHNGLNANGYNLNLITAIQRIVDACDVQLERAYSEELELRKKYTRELEIETEKARMLVLVDTIKKVMGSSKNVDKTIYTQFIDFMNGNTIKGWLEKEVEENYKNDNKEKLSKLQKQLEKEGFQLNCKKPSLYSLLRKLWLKRKDEKHDYLDVLFEEYLSYLDKIVWKHTPPPHFEKHKSVETVFFAQDDNFVQSENGKIFYRFWIYLKSNLNDGVKIPESINNICWDIVEEYKCTDVKKVFEDNGIKLLGIRCFYNKSPHSATMEKINKTNGEIKIKWEQISPPNNA